MTFLSYYGLSFNPFDKQQVKEKNRLERKKPSTMKAEIAARRSD